MAVERVLSNLNLISFKTEGGLQNHIDELQDGDLVFTPDNSLKGNLFDFKWTDHKLNDISWLNADTFSWQSGDVYVAAFEHLVSDLFQKGYSWQYQPAQGGQIGYTQSETPEVGQYLYTDGNKNLITEVGSGYLVVQNYKTGDSQRFERIDEDIESTNMFAEHETETVDDITITFYRAEDGHKICLADQEANVQRLYDWMGVAWYYVLDTANKQFKLPRTKYAFTGLRDEVGKYVEAGLPNITGEFYGQQAALTSGSGAFFTGNNPYGGTVAAGSANNAMRFDASRSSSVYGNSNTVQPKATQMYLYFYVGNFERDAIEQTAGLTSEQLNNKADTTYVDEQLATKVDKTYVNEQLATKANTDLSNIPSAYDYVVQTYKSGTTWYRKYKSGWVEQGGYDTGTVGSGANDSSETYTLLVPMQDSNYALTLGYGYGNIGGQNGKFGITAKTATNFTFRVISLAGNATGKFLSWQVSGYAA